MRSDLRLAPLQQRCTQPRLAEPHHSWSLRQTPDRGECHQRGSSCPRRSRPQRPPCLRHLKPGGDPSRNRGVWRGQMQRKCPARLQPGTSDKRRSMPPPSKIQRTDEWSSAGPHTWWPADHGYRGTFPARCCCKADQTDLRLCRAF